MLKKRSVDEEVKSKVLNRRVLKTMFTIILYMVKHRLPNDSFSDLLKLVADCGSEDIKKHLFETPKNATYMSPQSFAETLAAVNEFVVYHLFVYHFYRRDDCHRKQVSGQYLHNV